MNDYRKRLGKAGERIAQQYFLDNNYSVLEVNYRCSLGEIDLIVEKNNQLVFVEVKTRKSLKYGFPEESVNYRKQIKIRRVAEYYLLQNQRSDLDIRFDVVTIIMNGADKSKNSVNHIENAF